MLVLGCFPLLQRKEDPGALLMCRGSCADAAWAVAEASHMQVWESYTGEVEQANGASHADDSPQQAETTTVSVTDVTDATLFYFQVSSSCMKDDEALGFAWPAAVDQGLRAC